MLSHRLPYVLLGALLTFAGEPSATFAPRVDPTDACTLLTPQQVSAALEVTSQGGKHILPTLKTSCIWSDDTAASIDHRRVTLSILHPRGFDMPRSMGGMKTAPAPGVGDDAYYLLYGSDSPQLMVRKGNVQFSVRILNGFKFKPFTLDQEKTKEMALAQAAIKAL
ncbi:MAG TPA: hypothetical protein VFW04_09680 [Gemmatimonadaceae bacterium]|nr:hypothetical protein [Gemmatimonadaceae bacterium]